MFDQPQTIAEAARRLRRGELTPVELFEQCLERIDRHESEVKAWAYLDRKRARQEAELLTVELKAGVDRGPLHGIPIGIKDILDVYDMPTGCGSARWADSYARNDAKVVGRLRQAGALILGKTVTTPYAFIDPPPTRNPWNLHRTPGGSSSGSAAALACGMCLGALGTQTGGSLTRPASYCGIHSLKPTHGRIRVRGVLPLAPSLDHVGVMARSVRDLEILFDVVVDRRDARSRHNVPNSNDPGEEPRRPIARLGGFFDSNLKPELRENYESVWNRLQSVSKSKLEFMTTPPEFAHVLRAHRTIMAAEAAQVHATRFRRIPSDYPPAITQLIEDGLRSSSQDLLEARGLRSSFVSTMRAMLDDRIFVTPATKDFAPPPETTGDPVMNSPWSFVGFPTVSIPAGYSEDGLPFAIQLVGRDDSDEILLETAVRLESMINFQHRQPPVTV